jgi:hypothetical protein
MSLQNLVRLSQLKKKILSDYAHDTKMSKKLQCHTGYDIYDRFTMEHFPQPKFIARGCTLEKNTLGSRRIEMTSVYTGCIRNGYSTFKW